MIQVICSIGDIIINNFYLFLIRLWDFSMKMKNNLIRKKCQTEVHLQYHLLY